MESVHRQRVGTGQGQRDGDCPTPCRRGRGADQHLLSSLRVRPCQKFWDAVNFSRGANPPREQWKVPPQLPAEQTEQAFARFAKYIDHIKSLGVRFVTASELPAIYADRVRSEGLTETELLGLAKRLADPKATGVDYQVLAGKAVSPADQFELLAMAMGELIDGKAVKYPLAAKGLLGPDSAPGAAGGTRRVRANDRLAGVPRCGPGRARTICGPTAACRPACSSAPIASRRRISWAAGVCLSVRAGAWEAAAGRRAIGQGFDGADRAARGQGPRGAFRLGHSQVGISAGEDPGGGAASGLDVETGGAGGGAVAVGADWKSRSDQVRQNEF